MTNKVSPIGTIDKWQDLIPILAEHRALLELLVPMIPAPELTPAEKMAELTSITYQEKAESD